MDFVEKFIGEIDCDSIYLPVGVRGEEGSVSRFCTIGELTGETEEAMTDVKLRDNPGKIITALLFGIVESVDGIKKVTKDTIRNLTTIDRDFLIVMSRKVSFGNMVSWTDVCPSCRKPVEISVDIDYLPVKYLPIEYDELFSFELPNPVSATEKGKNVSIILPNGWIQEKVAPFGKSNPALATSMILQMITKKLGSLESPIDINVFKKMSSKNRNAINKYIADLGLGVDTSVKEQCAECGEEFTTVIPIQALLGE